MCLGNPDMIWEWLEGVSKQFCKKVKNKQKAAAEMAVAKARKAERELAKKVEKQRATKQVDERR